MKLTSDATGSLPSHAALLMVRRSLPPVRYADYMPHIRAPKMPGLARLQNFLAAFWMVWAIAAVALTFALGGWLIYRTLSRGILPVDAALGAELTPRLAMLLMIAWVPVMVGAAVGHRSWQQRWNARRPTGELKPSASPGRSNLVE